MIISLDTECTGLDLAHGAMPFLVTTCEVDGPVRFWEWDVDPLTRRPQIPDGDLADIAELIDAADLIYLQNAKFDIRALATIGVILPWFKVRDTLVMGHLLASNHPHDLTWMCVGYLGVDIEPFEITIKEVTRACRAIVKRDYPHWRIAREGDMYMPSVKESSKRDEDKPWKNDMWLARALILRGGKSFITEAECDRGYWANACSRYANADSEHTLYLGLELERLIRERGLWLIYEHHLQLPHIACEMEAYGVTAIGEYTEATICEYQQYSAEAADGLLSIAAEYGHDLELADGAALNDNMRDFFYGSIRQNCVHCNYSRRVKHWNGERVSTEPCPKCLKRKRGPMRRDLITTRATNLSLPVIRGKKTGNASLDKDTMQDYLTTLDGPALEFIQILTDKRKHDTDLSYMESYRRFWRPVEGAPGYYRIHPSLNPCGTDHLRWASNSPNLQNVGKQEDDWRVSVRRCFGPAPGREWYSMDYRSIERRIPPYECGEPKMLEVFEHPNDPPYWGSLYYLTASVLYPDEFWPRSKEPNKFKKECPKLYKQAKFFDLAKQYGCGRKKGDLLSKVRNSFDLVDNEFPLLASLQQLYLDHAERTGYVETLPDRTVDITRGYPILASRTEDGRVLSTTPFNYHISGTACWCKNTALVRCALQLEDWRWEGFDGHIALEIHDEILLDFPRGKTPDANRERAMVLKGLMEQSGEDLIPRIPTPVSVEYHAVSWAEGVTV